MKDKACDLAIDCPVCSSHISIPLDNSSPAWYPLQLQVHMVQSYQGRRTVNPTK